MNFPSEDSRELLKLLENREYAKAHSWLNRLCLVQLKGEEAGECLTAALHGTPNLFRKILSRCAPEENSGRVNIQLTEKQRVHVSGTLLTLAAALNKPEHVKTLLDAGYDPNSAGVASAAAFERMTFYVSNGVAHYGDRCGVGGNLINFSGKADWLIRNATPLAAAVACGSREAAAVLLRCPEVWKAESGVVCRATVSALQIFKDDPRQELAGMVFGKTRGKVFYPKDFVRTCDLQIEYSADFCPYDLLETQLTQNFCDEEGARVIWKTFEENVLFSRSTIRARMRKMNLLANQFPDLSRESWVTGLFLRELVRRYTPETPHVQLMKKWKVLCGEEGDLTWAHAELYRMSRPHLQSLLQELGKDTRLVMDADALSNFGKEAKSELMDLLTCVELRHNTGLEGISALAMVLLRHTDMRYLRKAAKLGAFAGERPEALLQALDRSDRSNLRAMMLAYGGQSDPDAVPRWKQELRRTCWYRWWDIEPVAYEDWLQQLSCEELEEEECLRRLHVMTYGIPGDTFWQSSCSIHVRLEENSRRKEVAVSAPEAAVCCGTQIQALRLLMQYMPEKLENRYRMEFHDHTLLDLEGTPLALAAATGRTDLVRFFLNSGLDPDETGRGCISTLRWFGNDALHVTPIMAAIYYGEEETAKLLLEAGAACDFSKPLFRKLLERGNEQTRELAAKLPNVNFESITPEWLESLQEKDFF